MLVRTERDVPHAPSSLRVRRVNATLITVGERVNSSDAGARFARWLRTDGRSYFPRACHLNSLPPPLIRPSTPLPTHNDLKITMVSTTIIPLNAFLPSFTVFNPLAHDLGDRWVGEPEARCRAYRAPGEYFFATR